MAILQTGPPGRHQTLDNDTVKFQGNIAIAMGHYYFTGPDGTETKVEYTFGYLKDGEGKLRIQLHHSSLPFSG